MNEKFNKNAKVEQLTKMFLRRGEEKALSLKILLFNSIYHFNSMLSIMCYRRFTW